MKLITNGAEHVLQQEDGKDRLLETVLNLTKAFALAMPEAGPVMARARSGADAAAGVTGADCADSGPLPTELVACTEKV